MSGGWVVGWWLTVDNGGEALPRRHFEARCARRTHTHTHNLLSLSPSPTKPTNPTSCLDAAAWNTGYGLTWNPRDGFLFPEYGIDNSITYAQLKKYGQAQLIDFGVCAPAA